jgi:Leucine-rich repeat (LRR) protein
MKNLLNTLLLVTLVFISTAQNPFDLYGPFNSEVYKDLKSAIANSKNVFKLDLSYQNIDQKSFEKIGKLSQLMNLQLNSNGITHLPATFCDLHNLVYFSSLNNPIQNWPCSFFNFPNLQYLEIGNSKIDTLPNSVIACQYLKILKWYSNADTLKITRNIRYMKKLTDIVIENAVLDSCPKVLFKSPYLKTLVLNKTNTWYLPEKLHLPENLEVLAIENNPISTIPWNIYQLKKLRVLSLRNTNVSKLPDSISELKNLEYLDIRGTKISSEDIEILKALLFGVEIKYDNAHK